MSLVGMSLTGCGGMSVAGCGGMSAVADPGFGQGGPRIFFLDFADIAK